MPGGYPEECCIPNRQQDHDLVAHVRIEEDLWNDTNENIVPLETDISKIPSHEETFGTRLKRKKELDAQRYNPIEAKLELEYYEQITLEKEKQTVIDSYEVAESFFRHLVQILDRCIDKRVLVGFDTEKELATLQLSLHVSFTEGDDYEANILLQMKTKDPARRHILKGDGKFPQRLSNFFSITRSASVG